MTDSLWGIDLGGTKIEGVVLSSDSNIEPLCRIRVPTEQQHGYQHIINQIALLVEKMKAEVGTTPSKIGFGTPGALNRQGLLKNSNTTCLNDKPLAVDIANKLGIEVALQNDANCFALTEAIFGAARGCDTVFGVIMGSGVGGGIVVQNKVLRGYQSIAGEWGHNTLEPNGEQCYCGKRGCVETAISGLALERFHRKSTGESKHLPDIVAAAEQGDPGALRTIDYLCENFGRAIAVVINILDPECIVLGGGVSNVPALYSKGIEAARNHVFNNELATKIVKNQLGDSAGVFGAALLTCQ
jgi:fructokinase